MGRGVHAPPLARPALKTRAPAKAHPSLGGNAYDPVTRVQSLTYSASGTYQHIPSVTPSERSNRRWRQQLQTHGTLQPFLPTGNDAAQVLRGHDEYLIAVYRRAYPKARADEVIAFVMNNSRVPRQLNRASITRCEQRLHLSRKAASTSAVQSELPINVLKARLYATAPPPLGIAGVNRNTVIDIDECALTLETPNRGFGKSAVGSRVTEPGPYGHSKKYTLIAGIMADGRRWMSMTSLAGTSVVTFNQFVEMVCVALPPGPPSMCFTWDNLSAHHSPLVAATVQAHGHFAVARAPYHPWTGAIEYIFNQIHTELQTLLHFIHSDADLIHYTRIIFANLGGFDATFTHVGI